MRVVSGSARGVRLFAPKNLKTRPTSDFIKESLFNIIRDDIFDCNFLDLFAGSGAIGIEALSRGARYACFVDIAEYCDVFIRRNLKATRLMNKACILKMDALIALKKLENIKKYDIIFVDPPYFSDLGFMNDILNTIIKYGILRSEGYVIMEVASTSLYNFDNGFDIFRVKEYSSTKLLFLNVS